MQQWRTHRFVASWFGSGLILRRFRGVDDGSGTVGSVVAFLIAVALAPAGPFVQAVAAAAVIGLSWWSARPFTSEGDPGWIVADEAAGTFVSVIGLSLPAAALALVVFRIADITKRFPGVARAERLPGAVGITADDVVAGLWALAAGWLAQGLGL